MNLTQIFENLISEYVRSEEDMDSILEPKLELLGELLPETSVLKKNFIPGFDLWKGRTTPVSDTYVVTEHNSKVKLVGYISFTLIHNNVGIVYVKKAYRNKGIGTGLYKFLLDKYKKIKSDIELSDNAIRMWTKEIPKFANVYLEHNGKYYSIDNIDNIDEFNSPDEFNQLSDRFIAIPKNIKI